MGNGREPSLSTCRFARPQGGPRCTRPAMMHNRRHLRQKPVMRHSIQNKNVFGCIISCQPTPARRQDTTLSGNSQGF